MTARDQGPRILVPLAEGFEEIEAVAIVDVLRRAGLVVTLAGLRPGVVLGSHGISVAPDAHLGELDLGTFTAIVLPGGMPGTRHLMADERVLDVVRRVHAAGGCTAAICAAPLVLQAAGILSGTTVTAHPSVRSELTTPRVEAEARVVRSGTIVTSSGAGTAIEFALALASDFVGETRAAEIARALRV